jgi:hypothetical protein
MRKKEITIQCVDGPRPYTVYIVPGTEGIFGVDNRFGSEGWLLTHIPCGYNVPQIYPTKKDAVRIARLVFAKVRRKKLLASSNPDNALKAFPKTIQRIFRSCGERSPL